MDKLCKYAIFIVISVVIIGSAMSQLDIDSSTKNENPKHFRTNGYSDNATVIIPPKEFNEIGIDDTLHYDRDRSQRYGPPYTDENDRRYYSNGNNEENFDYRSINRHLDDKFKNYDDDNDDKYYNQPHSPYYISEKQRNRYGYRESYSAVRFY